MTELKRLTDYDILKKFLPKSTQGFCDLTLGVKYMWQAEYVVDYAIIDNTLILKENCPEYKDAFYYPIGDNISLALKEIENYAKVNNIQLKFCCLDDKTACELSNYYSNVKIISTRGWFDYVYLANDMKSFIGKKYSGQRNHINKFKKTYPYYKFKVIQKSDVPRVIAFMDELKERNNFTYEIEKEEFLNCYPLFDRLEDLNCFGAYIEVNDKIIAISVGEKVNDTLYVHIEKGFKEYEGVYQTMVTEFATNFATEEIKFINREEDCDDLGLRTSKMQYHPISVKSKNILEVFTLFDKIKTPPIIFTERLCLSDITETDKENYFNLSIDDELNKFWGYDYKTDVKESDLVSPQYFIDFVNDLKTKKEEYSLAIRLDKTLIGEIVMHNFDYLGNLEIGFRLLKPYQGHGYALEALHGIIKYVLNVLEPKKIYAKCYKDNLKSQQVLLNACFKPISEDNTYFYFEYLKV